MRSSIELSIQTSLFNISISFSYLLSFELLQAKAITSSLWQKYSEWWSNIDTITAYCFSNKTVSTRQDSAIATYAGSVAK